MAKVQLPEQFSKWTGGITRFRIDAQSLDKIFLILMEKHPDLNGKFFLKNGNLQKYLRIFVDGQDIEEGNGLKTVLEKNSQVTLLMALAGG